MSDFAADGLDGTMIEVAAHRLPDGRIVRETLWGRESGTALQLLKSPLVAQGVAVGDQFEVDPEDGSVRVLRRSGNLCVQLFMRPELSADVFDTLAAEVRLLGGALDAHTATIAGFWVPASAGFPRVEKTFADFVDHHPGSTWMFTNVYGTDGEPLNWW